MRRLVVVVVVVGPIQTLRSPPFFFNGSTALYVPRPPHFVEGSRSHTLDTPHSVGLLVPLMMMMMMMMMMMTMMITYNFN